MGSVGAVMARRENEELASPQPSVASADASPLSPQDDAETGVEPHLRLGAIVKVMVDEPQLDRHQSYFRAINCHWAGSLRTGQVNGVKMAVAIAIT